jgi:hypothetical protein
MSPNEPQEQVTKKRVVLDLDGTDAVEVRRDVEFPGADGGVLALDVYRPPEAGSRPAVVIAAGYPDPGYQRILGCRFKDTGSSVSWARLIAASGMAAVTYTNREPEADLRALLQHLRQDAGALGIDASRIALWAGSGNVPLALSVLMRDSGEAPRCAVLCYGFTLDLDGATAVAEAARTFRFVNPCAGRTVDDLPKGRPLFVVRAGRDEFPGLNETLDRFVGAALAGNRPLTLVNHADAPHAFDLFHDSETSREIIRQILGFLRFHLLGSAVDPG